MQKKTKDEKEKEKMVMRSHAHQKRINNVRTRKTQCEETIKVIEATNSQLNNCP